MKIRLLTQIPGMTLAVLLTLLVGQGLVFGHDDRREPSKLEGTWDVTLRFPEETCVRPDCGGCPNNEPDLPIPNLNTFLKGGGMVWSGGSLFVGPGQGSWEGLGPNHFIARFKFLLFNPNGSRRGSEELTKEIRLTSSDTFEATTTFDFLDTAGNAIGRGCTSTKPRSALSRWHALSRPATCVQHQPKTRCTAWTCSAGGERDL